MSSDRELTGANWVEGDVTRAASWHQRTGLVVSHATPAVGQQQQQQGLVRPKTRNPTMEYRGSGGDSGGGGGGGVGGVLWSESSLGLVEGDMVRPHTSNPRYTDALRDTPSRENATPRSSANQSPAAESWRESGAAVSPSAAAAAAARAKMVLWAQDSTTLDPELIARPRTSNPWLRRQTDHHLHQHHIVPGNADATPTSGSGSGSGRSTAVAVSSSTVAAGGAGADATQPPPTSRSTENGILWSSVDVDDWHLLARPHASNPRTEHKLDEQGGRASMEDEVGTEIVAAQVLPIRNDNVAELQDQVATQSARIAALEREVFDLRLRLSTALGVSSQVLFPAPPGCVAPADIEEMCADGAGEVASCSLEGGVIGGSSAGRSPAPSRNADPRPDAPPHRASAHEADIAAAAAAASASPIRPTVAPAQCDTTQDDNSFFVRDDDGDGEAHALDELLPVPKRPQQCGVGGVDGAGAASSRRGRPQTAGPAAAAGAPRGAARNVVRAAAAPATKSASAVAALRPMSAPLRAPPPAACSSGAAAANATMSSFIECASALLVNDDKMRWEFDRLRQPGSECVIEKAGFKAFYMRKAEQFGMAPSSRELDRVLDRFGAAGRDLLTFDEFAVLYLKVAAW